MVFEVQAITVSIPKWYDLKIILGSGGVFNFAVSIPKWYDLKKNTRGLSHLIRAVSIPKWYDLKPLMPCHWERPFQTFQFQNGTI